MKIQSEILQNYTHAIAVLENSPIGTKVGTILPAEDRDSTPENRNICYQMVAGDGRAAFKLAAPNSTVLMTSAPLDRETKSSYELTIQTMDCFDKKFCNTQKSKIFFPF